MKNWMVIFGNRRSKIISVGVGTPDTSRSKPITSSMATPANPPATAPPKRIASHFLARAERRDMVKATWVMGDLRREAVGQSSGVMSASNFACSVKPRCPFTTLPARSMMNVVGRASMPS